MSTKNVPGLQDEEVLIGKGVPEPDESGNFGSIGGAVYATYAPWVVWNPGGNPSGSLANLGSAPAGGQIDPGAAVAVTSGGIIINLLFDAAAMAAPASFRAGIQQAASILSGAISDHITVNLVIDYSGTGGGASAGPDHGLYESYASVRTNLINGASPGDTSFNALPAGSSIQGQSNVAVWNAQLKLWGIIGANDTTTDDGSANFATDINPNLLVGVALHELTHAIGRVPYGPQPDVFDLFRYSSVGTRMFAGGNTASAAYFSVDNGNTKIADYNYFEGVTIRNTVIGIWAGTQFIAGSKGLTVKKCRFENVGFGVFTNYSGSSDFYIVDSYFMGRDDPKHLFGWIGNFWAQFDGVEGQKFPPKLASYTAVRLYGPGHVVAYNYVADFHDGIDIETYGNPDGSHAIDGPHYPPKEYRDKRPVSIDFYNNYMTNFHDNAFEIDGSMHNVRVMRNMMLNSASHPFCNQPAIGGPVYWIRNIAYHAPGGSTRMTNGAAGVLFYNNTILTETSAGSSANVHWRNNLMLGENSAPAIFSVNTNTNYSSSDYNGFRLNPGADVSFQWNSPPWNVPADYSGLLLANPGRGGARINPAFEARRFSTLAEYSRATHQDQHSVAVDYDIFVNVPRLDAQDLKKVQKLYKAEELDFRLKPGSAAIDRGVILPNITDGFAGQAPDLGALEVGQTPPHYGPRPFRGPNDNQGLRP